MDGLATCFNEPLPAQKRKRGTDYFCAWIESPDVHIMRGKKLICGLEFETPPDIVTNEPPIETALCWFCLQAVEGEKKTLAFKFGKDGKLAKQN